ncbi:MAG: aldo/keto reductase [Sporolactobacillus sp.]
MYNVTLNNGVKMPVLGYGVYQIADQEECERCVLDAINVGYRSIDTAQVYRNEAAVGRAMKRSGVPRDEFFVTTKIWMSNGGYAKAKVSIEESLRKLQLDYLDLLLIHQPFNDYYGTYRAMEEFYKAGKIRAIGVSNFHPDRYVDLVQFSDVVPAVNQVETHVFNQQAEARTYMKKYSTQIESWGPFAEGKNNLFTNPVLKNIGEAHVKSVAQVALRFLIQSGVVVIPKSTHKDRMEENFHVFDFELTAEEMEKITGLDTGKSLFFSHSDPKMVELLAGHVL